VHQVCGTSDSEIGWGYVKQIALIKLAADTVDVSRSTGGMRESKRYRFACPRRDKGRFAREHRLALGLLLCDIGEWFYKVAAEQGAA
jgi:hypothetical protein